MLGIGIKALLIIACLFVLLQIGAYIVPFAGAAAITYLLGRAPGGMWGGLFLIIACTVLICVFVF